MGTAASTQPDVGVSLNPRLEYAEKRAKKEGQPIVMDAPVLVKLHHGSVRYRRKDEMGTEKKERVERPHEGTEREKKHGYFFHAKLNDFSEQADRKKEDEHKFRYVFKGPTKAKQKKLYYVFGKGMHAKDKGLITGIKKPQGRGYQWPDSFQKPNHLYYNIEFLKQESEASESEDEGEDVAIESEVKKNTRDIQLKIHDEDDVEKVKKRLSLRLLKPVEDIHLCHAGKELENGEVIAHLRPKHFGDWKHFGVHFILSK